jgi:hypothetical protein
LLSFVLTVFAGHGESNKINRRVLFLTNSESGQANVQLATCHSVLVNHPDVEVHIASFPRIAPMVSDVSSFALSQSSAAQPIHFHPLSGPSFRETLVDRGVNVDVAINGPGLSGQTKFLKNLEMFLVPWTGPEYVALYHDIVRVIEEVDPKLIVVDTAFPPGMDATRNLGRQHVSLSTNTLSDNFLPMQPKGAMFWKHPAYVLAISFIL